MALSQSIRTVDCMATRTARQKTLQDGRTVTWLRVPLESGSGRFLCYVNTEGSVDGRAINDDTLHRLLARAS